MQRYFVEIQNWHDDCIIIVGNDAHHIQRVMRLQIGEKIICVHPNKDAFVCEIESLEQETVIVVPRQKLTANPELPVEVTIAQALPKGNKIELVLQKGTELGASHYILFQSERSVAKWNEKRGEKRLKRYEAIIKEASEQAHRNQIPSLTVAPSIKELIARRHEYTMTLFAYEEEVRSDDAHSLATVLQAGKENEKILICIGPEGGFSHAEAILLQEHQFIPVRLGKRILRTETASLYALASISYHFEELRCN